jgi:hypothetical protein
VVKGAKGERKKKRTFEAARPTTAEQSSAEPTLILFLPKGIAVSLRARSAEEGRPERREEERKEKDARISLMSFAAAMTVTSPALHSPEEPCVSANSRREEEERGRENARIVRRRDFDDVHADDVEVFEAVEDVLHLAHT